jgi:hypothetical protein
MTKEKNIFQEKVDCFKGKGGVENVVRLDAFTYGALPKSP